MQKYFEANVLIAQKKGLPNLLKQHVLVSDADIVIAKQCVKFLKQQIKSFYAATIQVMRLTPMRYGFRTAGY